VFLGANNAQNSAIPINSTEFCKKVEKNTLKQTVEVKKGAKKEANHRDLLSVEIPYSDT
jgi:hypothetical protein